MEYNMSNQVQEEQLLTAVNTFNFCGCLSPILKGYRFEAKSLLTQIISKMGLAS